MWSSACCYIYKKARQEEAEWSTCLFRLWEERRPEIVGGSVWCLRKGGTLILGDDMKDRGALGTVCFPPVFVSALKKAVVWFLLHNTRGPGHMKIRRWQHQVRQSGSLEFRFPEWTSSQPATRLSMVRWLCGPEAWGPARQRLSGLQWARLLGPRVARGPGFEVTSCVLSEQLVVVRIHCWIEWHYIFHKIEDLANIFTSIYLPI